MGCHIPKIWQIVTYLSYTPLISEEWVCTYLVGVQNIRNLATMHSTQRHTKTQRFPAMEKALWSSICTQQGPDYTDTYTKAYSIGVYVRKEDPSSRTYIHTGSCEVDRGRVQVKAHESFSSCRLYFSAWKPDDDVLLPLALAAGYSIYYYTSILHSKLFLLVFFLQLLVYGALCLICIALPSSRIYIFLPHTNTHY